MKIKNIRQIRPERVYAIQTSTHTFIADGLAHHNCYHCNINLSGNSDIYSQKITEKYGPDAITEIRKLRKETHKWTKEDYLEKIEYYKGKIC